MTKIRTPEFSQKDFGSGPKKNECIEFQKQELLESDSEENLVDEKDDDSLVSSYDEEIAKIHVGELHYQERKETPKKVRAPPKKSVSDISRIAEQRINVSKTPLKRLNSLSVKDNELFRLMSDIAGKPKKREILPALQDS